MDFKKVMANYVFVDKYAIKDENGKPETWEQSIERCWNVLRKKAGDKLNPYTLDRIAKAEKDKLFLSSQRLRQWADDKGSVENHNERLYNCCGSYADRPRFFGEAMYLLLCGCGVGYNICKRHVDKLPEVKTPETKGIYYVEDTIEGWANAVNMIMFAFLEGYDLMDINYSKLRKKGDLIAGRFSHSGYEPLKNALDNVVNFLHTKAGKKLKPVDVLDIVSWLAQAVVSAGTRRSACIALFSWDDKEMLHAKTGNWFEENPQRAMANISALMVRSKTKQKDIDYVLDMAKSFGEPGVVFADNEDFVTNP